MMDDQTALRYIVGLLDFLQRDNTLEELVNALEDASPEYDDTDPHEAQILWRDASLLRATNRELNTLINWAKNKQQ